MTTADQKSEKLINGNKYMSIEQSQTQTELMGNRSSQGIPIPGNVKSSDPDVPNTPEDQIYIESRDRM